MAVQIISKDNQANGAFNGGEILEKKPIGFPQDGGKQKPYSNLFYWAHAWNDKDSQIGLHPHQGFEILSFVLDGKIDHYDTKNKSWFPLQKGDVQIIRSGSGISHSEIFRGGCSMFQIWFDPDISKALGQPATYDYYKSGRFPVSIKNGVTTKLLKGEGAPIQMDSEGVTIKELSFGKQSFELVLNPHTIYSCYLIEGEITVDDQEMNKENFSIIQDMDTLNVKGQVDHCTLFIVETPKLLSYKSYAERFSS